MLRRPCGAVGIMSAQDVGDPKHWRDRAAQMRALSDWTEDAETKATMLKLADEYDKIAERIDSPLSRQHMASPVY
jgi:hypothetical protein